MTTKYLQRLYMYNHWCSQRVLESLIQAPERPEKTELLFSHIIAAERVWLTRLLGKDSSQIEVIPLFPLLECEMMIEELHKDWQRFLEDLSDERFSEIISYRTSKGVPQKTATQDILVHVVNHGTHHRAQIGQLLRQNGEAPAVTDFIFFARND